MCRIRLLSCRHAHFSGECWPGHRVVAFSVSLSILTTSYFFLLLSVLLSWFFSLINPAHRSPPSLQVLFSGRLFATSTFLAHLARRPSFEYFLVAGRCPFLWLLTCSVSSSGVSWTRGCIYCMFSFILSICFFVLALVALKTCYSLLLHFPSAHNFIFSCLFIVVPVHQLTFSALPAVRRAVIMLHFFRSMICNHCEVVLDVSSCVPAVGQCLPFVDSSRGFPCSLCILGRFSVPTDLIVAFI